jgi:hypothetical protein
MPEAHDSTPSWQGSALAHAAPGRHAVHVPALQIRPAPHGVPSGKSPPELAPVSLQTGPCAHESWPVGWQGFAVVQAVPGVQATQMPPWHTWFVPQAVPSAAAAPVSAQAVPAVQVTVPAG